MKISRNWLQTYFEKELPSVQEIEQALVLHAFETEGILEYVNGDYHDDVIEIDVLPNRAHDALCHRGVARDLAAILNRDDFFEEHRYEKLFGTFLNKNSSNTSPKVTVKNPEQCRRYMARLIQNITVNDSPEWLKNQLESIGQRSINNVVDVTNYLMFDLGNPVHIFDADKVVDQHIVVRSAISGETMKTLGGEQEITLDASMLVIADAEKVLALAGVKGGNTAEVTTETKNILLEVANFEPLSTRKTRQKTGIMTDSSKRFENEIEPERTEKVITLLAQAIVESAGSDETMLSAVVDEWEGNTIRHTVTFSLEKVNRLLGIRLSQNDVENVLKRLCFAYTFQDENIAVTVPAERIDIRIAEDMIEEIGRIYGYHNIPIASLDDIQFQPQVLPLMYYQNKVRDFLVQEGFSEVMTYSFQKKGDIEVTNPVAKDKPALRKNLAKGLSIALEKNLYQVELFGQDIIRIFEFGKVFRKDTQIENFHLALAVENKTKQARKKYGEPKAQLKALVEKLEKAFGFQLSNFDGEGNILEIDFEEVIKDFSVPEHYENLDVELSHKKFTPISPYPFITRDIALWVEVKVTSSEIEEVLRNMSGDLLVRIDLFDEFSKEGKVSYAFRMVFQSYEKTLSDEEVNVVMEKVNATLLEKGWEVR